MDACVFLNRQKKIWKLESKEGKTAQREKKKVHDALWRKESLDSALTMTLQSTRW